MYWKVIPVTTIGIMFLTTFGSYATTGIARDVRMSHIFHDNESCRNTGILTTLGISYDVLWAIAHLLRRHKGWQNTVFGHLFIVQYIDNQYVHNIDNPFARNSEPHRSGGAV